MATSHICEMHNWYNKNDRCPACAAAQTLSDTIDIRAPDIELIQAQQAGADICGRTPLQKLADTLNEAVRMVAELPEDKRGVEVSGTFGFYVDGYTLASTDEIGEVTLTSYDGRTCVVKSSALVAWIERRLTPAEETS